MKKYIFITCVIIIIIFSIFYIKKIENIKKITQKEDDQNLVYVKAFVNENCIKCTQVEDYLEVYEKAWVNFWTIDIKKYNTLEYIDQFRKYNITKLPFIVFSEELNNYETISSSWNNTFGYRNEQMEYISTDITPPYFDIEAKKVKWLIDIVYIWNRNCDDCYKIESIIWILRKFWLRFNNVNKIDKDDKEAIKLIEKYNIDTFPVILLSENTKLYVNFSYFWKTIWSIEDDWSYILRKPWKIGLKIKE